MIGLVSYITCRLGAGPLPSQQDHFQISPQHQHQQVPPALTLPTSFTAPTPVLPCCTPLNPSCPYPSSTSFSIHRQMSEPALAMAQRRAASLAGSTASSWVGLGID